MAIWRRPAISRRSRAISVTLRQASVQAESRSDTCRPSKSAARTPSSSTSKKKWGIRVARDRGPVLEREGALAQQVRSPPRPSLALHGEAHTSARVPLVYSGRELLQQGCCDAGAARRASGHSGGSAISSLSHRRLCDEPMMLHPAQSPASPAIAWVIGVRRPASASPRGYFPFGNDKTSRAVKSGSPRRGHRHWATH